MKRIRNIISRNAIALVALFFALSGTAVAGALVTGAQIQDESVTGADILNESLTGADIKNGSITGSDIGDTAVPLATYAVNAGNSTESQNAQKLAGKPVDQFLGLSPTFGKVAKWAFTVPAPTSSGSIYGTGTLWWGQCKQIALQAPPYSLIVGFAAEAQLAERRQVEVVPTLTDGDTTARLYVCNPDQNNEAKIPAITYYALNP
jgi:hypothetical protein